MGLRDFLSKYRGQIALLGSFLMHFTLGTIYTYGNISPYLISYLHHYDPDIEVRHGSWILTACLISNTIFMWVGGYVELLLGTRQTALLGGILYSIGVFVSSYVLHSFVLLIIFYGVIPGLGIGLAYGVDCSVAVRWFPKNAGLVTGIVLSAYSLGSVIYSPILTAIINRNGFRIPDGEVYYTFSDLVHLKSCLRILGCTYLGIQIIATLSMTNPPGFDLKKQKGDKEYQLGGLEPTQVLKTGAFYLIWSIIAINCFCSTILSSFWKQLALENVTKNDQLLSYVGSINSLLNSGGRIFWGYVNDRLLFKDTIILLYFLLIIFCCIIGYVNSAPLFIIIVGLIYFIEGGNYAQFPATITYCFGPKRLQMNLGLGQSGNIITALLATAFATLLMDQFGINGLFTTIGVFLFITIVIFMIFFVNKHWTERVANNISILNSNDISIIQE